MAKDIIILGSTPLAQDVTMLRDLLAAVREQCALLKGRMDHMIVASPADYTMLETQAGIAAGQGAALYALIATNVNANLNTGAVATSLDGFVNGVTR